MRFGSAVKAARTSLRISQDELAFRAGFHRTYISDIERGARNLSLSSIPKLAMALKVSVPSLSNHGVSGHVVEILMVEDNLNDVELALEAFRRAKCTNRMHVVHDGAEALDYLFGENGTPRRPA